MKKVVVLLDPQGVQISIDLLRVARELYPEESYRTYGLSVLKACSQAQGYFDELLVPSEESVESLDPKTLAQRVSDLVRECEWDCILVPATVLGRMVAPRIAARLKTGLVADVTGVTGGLGMIRPAFTGRMLATIKNRSSGPLLMTVRPHTFRYHEEALRPTLVRSYEINDVHGSTKFLEQISHPGIGDIREGKVLVSAGGGATRVFPLVEELAAELGGMVAASRKVVDGGIAPRFIQVGQSGKTVSPRLYLAVGISGSIQHVIGLKNAQFVISVNKDRNAPICSLSDLVVEGDALEFLESMIGLLRSKKNGNN